MQFSWNKELGMHSYCGEKTREEKKKRKEKVLIHLAEDIFSQQNHVTYIELCDQVQNLLDVKERTAKSYVRFMREKGVIIKDPTNQNYFILGQLNS